MAPHSCLRDASLGRNLGHLPPVVVAAIGLPLATGRIFGTDDAKSDSTNSPARAPHARARTPTPTAVHEHLLPDTNTYCRTPTPTAGHQHLLLDTNTYCWTPTPTAGHQHLLPYTKTYCRTPTPTAGHQHLLLDTNTHCRTPTPTAGHQHPLPDTNTSYANPRSHAFAPPLQNRLGTGEGLTHSLHDEKRRAAFSGLRKAACYVDVAQVSQRGLRARAIATRQD